MMTHGRHVACGMRSPQATCRHVACGVLCRISAPYEGGPVYSTGPLPRVLALKINARQPHAVWRDDRDRYAMGVSLQVDAELVALALLRPLPDMLPLNLHTIAARARGLLELLPYASLNRRSPAFSAHTQECILQRRRGSR